MVGNLSAWNAAKKAIEATYDGVCDVVVRGEIADPISHITRKTTRVVYEKMPCRISFRNNNLNISAETDTASEVTQKIKLFVNPDAEIPKGSEITVMQNGVTQSYKSSSEPMRYFTHQEIILELSDRWC